MKWQSEDLILGLFGFLCAGPAVKGSNFPVYLSV